MSTPDVSVVVPVYNTMPYLKATMRSLVSQTIGPDRMEVIAVDDGSTDGSGRLLDRYARRYPGMIRVIHQANSGGPAGPCNRALDMATGRYVFFLGGDDYLAPHALERLVAAADAWESDVLLGKMVGVNNRWVDHRIYARSEPDIGLFDSVLPYSLANTKLFRRDLIERHKLRYPEDMPIGSDYPFTLEACYRARRISVLADDNYYFAVRRLNSANISYSSRHAERLRCAEQLMRAAADLIPDREQREVILARNFNLEVARLLGDDLLHVDRSELERTVATVRTIADEYLTDTLARRLDVEARIRLSVVRDGTVDDLVAVMRYDAEHGVVPTVMVGDRSYAAYPGVAKGADPRFDVTDAPDWVARLAATSVAWESDRGRRMLTVTARSPLADLAARSSTPVEMCADEMAGETTVAPAPDGGSTVRVRFPVSELVAQSAPWGRRRSLCTVVTALGRAASAPVRAARVALPRPVLCWWKQAAYVVGASRDTSGRLMIVVTPLTAGRVFAHLAQRRRAHSA